MTETELDRALQSVGLRCFVEFIDLFENLSVPPAEAASNIADRKGYDATATRTRVSRARAIIRAGRTDDALRRIAVANVEAEVAALARQLLDRR